MAEVNNNAKVTIQNESIKLTAENPNLKVIIRALPQRIRDGINRSMYGQALQGLPNDVVKLYGIYSAIGKFFRSKKAEFKNEYTEKKYTSDFVTTERARNESNQRMAYNRVFGISLKAQRLLPVIQDEMELFKNGFHCVLYIRAIRQYKRLQTGEKMESAKKVVEYIKLYRREIAKGSSDHDYQNLVVDHLPVGGPGAEWFKQNGTLLDDIQDQFPDMHVWYRNHKTYIQLDTNWAIEMY